VILVCLRLFSYFPSPDSLDPGERRAFSVASRRDGIDGYDICHPNTKIPVVGDELEFVNLPAQYWPWLLTIIVLYCSLTAGLMHTVLPRLLRFRRRSDSTRRRGGFRRNDDKKSAIKILVADKLN